MRITENDLGSHVDQLIDQEQPAFKHFLVDKYSTICLCSCHQNHTQQIRCKARPDCISDGEDGAIDESIDFIILLARNEQIITAQFHFNPEPLKNTWYNTKMRIADIPNGDFRFRHCSEPDETPDFNHIRKHAVCCSAHRCHSFNGEHIGSDTADFSSHPVEHITKLLDVRLTGCIVNSCNALRHHSSEDYIGCSGNRCFIKKHECSF